MRGPVHLWQNLGESVKKTVTAHRGCLPEPERELVPETTVDSQSRDSDREIASVIADTEDSVPPEADLDPLVETKPIVVQFRERHAAVQVLSAQGSGIRAIAWELNLDRKTARRFFYATGVEELLAKALDRPSLLDEFKPYLNQRFNQGCSDIATLTSEIREQGYRGSERGWTRGPAAIGRDHRQSERPDAGGQAQRLVGARSRA